MYFRELVKGKKWVCVAEGPRDPRSGKRKQISRRGKTKGEAKTKVEQAIREAQQLLDYDAKILFSQFAVDWYQHYRNRGNKENTNMTREFGMRWLNEYFGNIPLQSITPKLYQAMLDDLFKEGKSRSSLTIIHTTGRSIFEHAASHHLINKSPAAAARIPRKKVTVEDLENTKVEELFLERYELAEFLEKTDDYSNYVYAVLIYVLAFSGMRPGEAVALQETDVYRQYNQIWVSKTLFRRERQKAIYELTPPKTDTSIRKVDMDPTIISMIDSLLEYKKRHGFKKSPFLFTTPDGFPLSVDQTRQVITRIGKKTTIQKHLFTYILRHTHISILAGAGEGLPEIMKRVGHKNSETTTQIYMHVTKEMRERTVSRLAAEFNQLMDIKEELKRK
ncbi:site-specific integrase [Planococcus sp. A6]|uniref:tyrosine-type recombinase/integrase n=1 Tax=Planococcus sp. A6 TaxID=2992760 RepID=UPI00237A1BA6|nr:site-specific integrase [Planococcus sp. A6]MDE0581511.1 site-specific integrase [Planococcus sp. A6]